jgi:hypothetical protein
MRYASAVVLTPITARMGKNDNISSGISVTWI